MSFIFHPQTRHSHCHSTLIAGWMEPDASCLGCCREQWCEHHWGTRQSAGSRRGGDCAAWGGTGQLHCRWEERGEQLQREERGDPSPAERGSGREGWEEGESCQRTMCHTLVTSASGMLKCHKSTSDTSSLHPAIFRIQFHDNPEKLFPSIKYS